MSKNQSKKQPKKSGKALKIVVALLAFVLVGALATSVTFNVLMYKELAHNDETANAQPPVIITPIDTEFMSITPYALSISEPDGEYVSRLTATPHPENATYTDVDWDIEFANPDSEWASGKNVTDYVTVTPTKDGALTADVKCLQEFGEQIIVTVKSRSNPEAYATCIVDYAVRYTIDHNRTKAIFQKGDASGNLTNGCWLRLGTIPGIGTVDDTVRSIEFKIKSEFIERLFARIDGLSSDIWAVLEQLRPNGIYKDIVLSESKQAGETGSVFMDMKCLAVAIYDTSEGFVLKVGAGADTGANGFAVDDEHAFYNLLGIDDELYYSMSLSDKNALNSALNAAINDVMSNACAVTVKVESSYYETEQINTAQCYVVLELPSYTSSITVDKDSIVF